MGPLWNDLYCSSRKCRLIDGEQRFYRFGDHLLVPPPNKLIFRPVHLPGFCHNDRFSVATIIVFNYPGNKYDPKSDYNLPTPSRCITTM